MKHASFLAATAAIALLGFAAPAYATHSVDGSSALTSIETENATVTLTADLQCASDPNALGIILEANGITLNLNGFAIRAGAEGFIGIATPATQLRRISIGGGTIEGFTAGIQLGAIESRVARMTIVATVGGIFLIGYPVDDPGAGSRCEPRFNGNSCIFQNDVTITPGAPVGFGAQFGIAFGDMNDGHIWGNTVRATTPLNYGAIVRMRSPVASEIGRGSSRTPCSAQGAQATASWPRATQTFAMISQNTVGDLDATSPTSGQCFNGINVKWRAAPACTETWRMATPVGSMSTIRRHAYGATGPTAMSAAAAFLSISRAMSSRRTRPTATRSLASSPMPARSTAAGIEPAAISTNTPGSTEPQCVNVTCAGRDQRELREAGGSHLT